MRTILLIILVILIMGALPTWPYSAGWGYYPSGGLGLLLLILLLIVLLRPSAGWRPTSTHRCLGNGQTRLTQFLPFRSYCLRAYRPPDGVLAAAALGSR